MTSDFTRLTLDTIALCAMDYRFNSFYQDDLHPFVQAMTSTLAATSDRLKVSSLVRKMLPWDKTADRLKVDREYMGKLAMEMVKIRRENPTEKRDLLNAMVNGIDPKTGETMSDELISANMVTFLIAGHETTSGLLSFAFLYLLKNPSTYFKAQEEVDRVIGRGRMATAHLKDLKYIDAILRETLRLCPTAPAFVRSIRRDNPNDIEPLAGGKYSVNRDDKILCMITKSQRDPAVYGEDANEFRPERMLDEHFNKLPTHAWKPFGSGVRACIGRAFAWQEAQMCIAMLLQNFNFRLDDPAYEMKIKQTLTLKPEGFYMRATLREGISAVSLQTSLLSSSEGANGVAEKATALATSGSDSDLKPMTILYGSNTGTCQSLAQSLSVDARRYGYHANVMDMDAAVGTLPKAQPTVIITASYEGQPPDNAGQFVAWLETLEKSSQLEGVEYAVFGCGHSDWTSTFQRVPTVVDEMMKQNGAKRLADRGLANAADANIFSDFENWTDHVFWPSVADVVEDSKAGPVFEVELSNQNRSTYLRQDVRPGTVTESRCLTAPGEPEKRHLDIKLPEGMSYGTGDYLAILPLNPRESVDKVVKHFGLSPDATITIKPGAATFLPVGVTLSVVDLLRGYVELGLPATKKDLQKCIDACDRESDKSELQQFLKEKAFADMVERRISLLDLLLKYPSTRLAFAAFLSILPPLRPRHYSISSSPLADAAQASITYGVINETAKSGIGRYIGVAGNYLAALNPGDEIQVSVRATNKFFHLPTNPDTPVMMFGAGTGIAPFRGFIQERAIQLAGGRKLAPALMLMGCRSETKDRLYGEEIDAWAKAGAVDVRYAFSRESKTSDGCRYVQHRLLKDREDVLRLWRDGAKVFTCGSPDVSEGLSEVAQQILVESMEERGEKMTADEARDWFREKRNERFVVDVF